MTHRRVQDARQAAAINKQIALEKEAAEKRQTAHEALLASMPEDLRGLYQVGLGFDFIAGLLKRGMFPNDSHQSVREAHEFLHRHVVECDHEICAHPRFAEFFPEQAAKAEARRLAMEAEESAPPDGPVLVGPDGAPLDLSPAPNIVHVEEQIQ